MSGRLSQVSSGRRHLPRDRSFMGDDSFDLIPSPPRAPAAWEQEASGAPRAPAAWEQEASAGDESFEEKEESDQGIESNTGTAGSSRGNERRGEKRARNSLRAALARNAIPRHAIVSGQANIQRVTSRRRDKGRGKGPRGGPRG